MFRPEVVLSWKARSIHIFRDLSRNSAPETVERGMSCALGGGHQTEVRERRPLILGRKATSGRPLWGFSS
jgi:hypothetical protein